MEDLSPLRTICMFCVIRENLSVLAAAMAGKRHFRKHFIYFVTNSNSPQLNMSYEKNEDYMDNPIYRFFCNRLVESQLAADLAKGKNMRLKSRPLTVD